MSDQVPVKTGYYKGYDDPTADMVLEVEGGVKFRVHSYLLKAHSQFFRNMPDHDKELCGASAKEIVFDADPRSFAALLGLIDSQPMTNIHVWSDVEMVIALGVRYLFIHLDGAIYRAIGQKHLQGDPWNVFVLASSHDLPLLASRAIADFGRTHLWEYSGGEIAPQVMKAVNGSYAIALLYAMKSNLTYRSRTNPKNGRLDRGQVMDWLGASRAFTV